MWIGTHIGIKGFPEFHVHVGNMNIKRSVGLSRPLEYLDAGGLLMLFIAYGSVSQWLLYDCHQWGKIHIDLSKSLLIHRKRRIGEYFTKCILLYATGQCKMNTIKDRQKFE